MDAKTPVMPSLETSPAMAEHTISAAAATQGAEALKDIAYGSVAGIAGKFVEYPFDTVKVRLQSQPDHLPLRYAGPLDCFRQSIQQDGFRGLYRGISAPLFGAAAETSSLFFSVSEITTRPTFCGADRAVVQSRERAALCNRAPFEHG